MHLLTVDTLEQAQNKIYSYLAKNELKTEKIALTQAFQYILAEDIHAPFAVPHFRRSTVDGYAIHSLDTVGAGESIPCFLKVLGAVEMGEENRYTVRRGECVYVPTGGMLPNGADAMLMIEYAEKFGENEIACYQNVKHNQYVVDVGEDIPEKSLVLEKGTILRPHEIGVLASLGLAEVLVYAKPTVAIISLGDEILQAGERLEAGKIYDVNTYGLYAQAVKFGFAVQEYHHVKDDREAICRMLENVVHHVDIVCVSGGSSQGEKDFTASLLAEISTTGILTHGIAVKPGKPTITAYDEKNACLLLGLPGHPVAAMLLFELLAAQVYRKLWQVPPIVQITAKMACNFPSADGRLTCQLVQLEREGHEYTAIPIFGKSGVVSSLAKAQGYILVGMNSEGVKKDEQVCVYLI